MTCKDCFHRKVCRLIDVEIPDEVCRHFVSDVVEVRHGRVHHIDRDEWWGAVCECSLCGEIWMLECSSYKAHYCPWCGAKMDGERREE